MSPVRLRQPHHRTLSLLAWLVAIQLLERLRESTVPGARLEGALGMQSCWAGLGQCFLALVCK